MMADRTTALGALQFPCTLGPVPLKSKHASPCGVEVGGGGGGGGVEEGRRWVRGGGWGRGGGG